MRTPARLLACNCMELHQLLTCNCTTGQPHSHQCFTEAASGITLPAYGDRTAVRSGLLSSPHDIQSLHWCKRALALLLCFFMRVISEHTMAEPQAFLLTSRGKSCNMHAGSRLPTLRLLLLACCTGLACLLPLATARSTLGAAARRLPHRRILGGASPPMLAQGSGVRKKDLTT